MTTPNPKSFRLCLFFGGFIALLLIFKQPLIAEATSEPEAPTISILDFVQKGRAIGYVLILMSFVSVGFAIEHALTISRSNLIPRSFLEDVNQLLDGKQYDEATKRCEENRSFAAGIIAAGLSERGTGVMGYIDMQTAMQEAGEAQASKFYRKIEVLSVVSRVAPMLGLLGTVTGMIRAFETIARAESAPNPADLAVGISEALVTTCMGLIVAIPTFCIVSFFRNKLDGLVGEAEATVEHMMSRFKKV
ncbi:MAG: MotA/TolQ/ExbB proton channel family protein [Planctomycetota bacterium]|nr:MotA/TolQ/ExbB proton channel family protein [Planctomycetota bacterium]MDA1141616.1 MotA/TolQ/ExbB proton channel family protein [Planctomycetota bacterium]